MILNPQLASPGRPCAAALAGVSATTTAPIACSEASTLAGMLPAANIDATPTSLVQSRPGEVAEQPPLAASRGTSPPPLPVARRAPIASASPSRWPYSASTPRPPPASRPVPTAIGGRRGRASRRRGAHPFCAKGRDAPPPRQTPPCRTGRRARRPPQRGEVAGAADWQAGRSQPRVVSRAAPPRAGCSTRLGRPIDADALRPPPPRAPSRAPPALPRSCPPPPRCCPRPPTLSPTSFRHRTTRPTPQRRISRASCLMRAAGQRARAPRAPMRACCVRLRLGGGPRPWATAERRLECRGEARG
eukprot:scaffold24742_cov123-Isochrysis_galbana.AAC.3